VGVNNFVKLDHSLVRVDNLVKLDHGSVGAGADNEAMLNQTSYLMAVGQCSAVEESAVVGHSYVGVDNFVAVRSFFHPLAQDPDCCKRDSLDCLALNYFAD
jgi:hypothetical protein